MKINRQIFRQNGGNSARRTANFPQIFQTTCQNTHVEDGNNFSQFFLVKKKSISIGCDAT
jgi:hypothetical protein